MKNAKGTAFAGSLGGAVYRSTDNGLSWEQKANGWNQMFVWSIIATAGYVLAGTDFGIFRYSEQTGAWQATHPEIPIYSMFANPFNASVFACKGKWIYRSTDAGDSWHASFIELANEITSMTFDANDDIYATNDGYGVFKSTDGSKSWDKINDIHGPDAIFAAPTGSMFLASHYDTLYRSDDRGQTWKKATRGMTSRGIRSFASNSKGDIFAAGGGIFRTRDNGESWLKTVNGITNMNISQIIINRSDHLFVSISSGNAGMFMSTDDGDSWVPINGGLSYLDVSGLDLDANGFLYANTRYEGVYRSTESTITYAQESRIESISTYALLPNFPNPFNPKTIIRYSLPRRENISIKIYDILGREITVLVEEPKEPGTWQVEWDAQEQPSGVYLSRMTVGMFVETRKLLLIR